MIFLKKGRGDNPRMGGGEGGGHVPSVPPGIYAQFTKLTSTYLEIEFSSEMGILLSTLWWIYSMIKQLLT